MTNREKLNNLNNKEFAEYAYSVFVSGKVVATRQAMGVPVDKNQYAPKFFPNSLDEYERWLEQEAK